MFEIGFNIVFSILLISVSAVFWGIGWEAIKTKHPILVPYGISIWCVSALFIGVFARGIYEVLK